MRYVVCLLAVLLTGSETLAAEATGGAAATAESNQLNVLFIAIDDLRPELGCYGAPVKSPHLDGLAARGLLFERAYCQQTLCSPSRISLLSGLRPDTTRIYDLETHPRTTMPDVVTLPQLFKQHGYHAQSFGKIYHDEKINDEASWSVPHVRNQANQYHDPKILAQVRSKGAEGWEIGGRNKGPAWESADCDDSDLPDGWLADRAIEALREVKDRPFFLAVGFIKPHLPFVAPKKYFDLYPPAGQIELSPAPDPPVGVPKLAMTNFAELRAYTDVPGGDEPIGPKQARELRRAYYASVSYVDAQVGRVLTELDRLGLRDNTIVIVWGDHGWHLGDLGLWCKHTNFEVAARSAMMISAPGMKQPGAKTRALVELVDVYPTLCELAGLPLPAGLEGKSFAPLLDDPSQTWKAAAFSQYPRGRDVMGYSMKTDRYRYTEWQRRGNPSDVVARELYDHETDPQETQNLADDPQHAQTVERLSRQLQAGWKE